MVTSIPLSQLRLPPLPSLGRACQPGINRMQGRSDKHTDTVYITLHRMKETEDIYSPDRYLVLIYKYHVSLASPFITHLDNCHSLSLGSKNRVPEKGYKIWE